MTTAKAITSLTSAGAMLGQPEDATSGAAQNGSDVAPPSPQKTGSVSGSEHGDAFSFLMGKQDSYVNAVLSHGCAVAGEPDAEGNATAHVQTLKKCKTMDADEIELSDNPLRMSKSVLSRYMASLATKSSSRVPRTPSTGALSLRSLPSGLMTPPVSSLCPLASGPMLEGSQADEISSDALDLTRTESRKSTAEELEPRDNVDEPQNETSKQCGNVEEAMETDEPELKTEEAASEENGEENMETSTTAGKETGPNTEAKVDSKREDDAAEDLSLDVDVVAPPPPVLSPVNSFPSAGSSTAPPAATPTVAPFGGPAPVQIAFSFDTTGSMSQCIDEVRTQLRDIIQRLLGDVPFLQVAVMAHGDYCDEKEFFTLKAVDFTNDVNKLTQFVDEVGGTGGGDWEECYEYVLRSARALSWAPGTQRSLVMIGDAVPHDAEYPLNVLNLDWKEEADYLHRDLVR